MGKVVSCTVIVSLDKSVTLRPDLVPIIVRGITLEPTARPVRNFTIEDLKIVLSSMDVNPIMTIVQTVSA